MWFANGGFVDPIRADAERPPPRAAARGADHPMDEADARQNRRRNRWMRLLASLFGPRRVRHRHGGEREMGGVEVRAAEETVVAGCFFIFSYLLDLR